MLYQLAHLINTVRSILQLPILVFWNALGIYFSNVRFCLIQISFNNSSSLTHLLTILWLRRTSRVTVRLMNGLLASSTHLLICRRSSVCSWPCLSNRRTEPPPRASSLFFFLLGFFGLDENNNPVWKRSFLHCFLPFDTFTIPFPLDHLIRLLAYNSINSPRLASFLFWFSRFVLLGEHDVVIKLACFGIVAARRLVW